ncbi:MAG: hypothetical protein AAF841_07575 [Pseudomonadota bacterium]
MTYAIALLLFLALPYVTPGLAPLFAMSPEAAIGKCALLGVMLLGLKLHFVYTAVPLAGYEVFALIKGVAGGYTLSNLPHLIMAIFAFVVLASLIGKLWQRYIEEARAHDPRAHCARPRRAFADVAIRVDGRSGQL